jgi:hypothetical protein
LLVLLGESITKSFDLNQHRRDCGKTSFSMTIHESSKKDNQNSQQKSVPLTVPSSITSGADSHSFTEHNGTAKGGNLKINVRKCRKYI